jgi:hypothetical protein
MEFINLYKNYICKFHCIKGGDVLLLMWAATCGRILFELIHNDVS